MSASPNRRWDADTNLLLWFAACVSVASFLFYLRRGDQLLYGDAVAHINIARRVFDSRTPGILQLGTVWLPLPHLLMIPFLLSDWAWQSGVGGSIASLAAYVFGVLGIFRLVRYAVRFPSRPDTMARVAAWIAAGVYAANPNLIYLHATAMTEPLYLALFIWTVVHFSEFVQEISQNKESPEKSGPSSLVKCGLCLMAACLTRYDGWLLACVLGTAAVLVVTQVVTTRREKIRVRGFRSFMLLALSAPVLWVAYNAIVYGNPLEFANGPYSATAIERKSAPESSPHPGTKNLLVAASYFLKSSELIVAPGNWGRLWWLLAMTGSALALSSDRRVWPLLVLWIPLIFYSLSIAYGGVPVFLPVWWPFSYYNVRYGLEMLPAFAVFAALAVPSLAILLRHAAARTAIVMVTVAFVAISYAWVWRESPICLREALVNSRARIALETEVAGYLKGLPRDSTLLMYLGNHVGAVQRAGIPLRRVINEGNHRSWAQPSDPEGLWERALANPAEYAQFVVAFEGDPVSAAMRTQRMLPLAVLHVSGQPVATIYKTQAEAR